MKEVVKLSQNSVVGLDSVSRHKYYGFIVSGNSPGLILRDNDGYFQAHFFWNITDGNPWQRSQPTLTECISRLMDNNEAKIFEFDTHQELFKWASDQP